jgi:hypothetical protein
MLTYRTIFAAIVCATVCASHAPAQIMSLVREGDFIAGVGTVTGVDGYAVNNSGQWIVQAATDNPDPNINSVILRSGVVYWQENDAFAGLAVSSWDDHSLNNAGEYGGNLFLRPTGPGDSAIHFNKSVVVQEGAVSNAAAFTPGTPYIGFFGVKIKDNRSGLIVASIDDPNIASTVDRAMMRFTTTAGGGIANEVVIAKEGDILPGTAAAVSDFKTGSTQFGLSQSGVAIYGATLVGGGDAIYTSVGASSTLVAIEGGASPAAGRTWANLASSTVSISGNGLHTSHTGVLSGDTATDNVIVRNGAIFKQEGDSITTANGTFQFTGFGTVGTFVDDAGNLVWYGDWNDPNTAQDTGLFYNDMLILQEGVTQIDGLTLMTVRSFADTLTFSDNGAFILFEGELAGGIEGAFMIAVPEPGSLALVGLAAAGVVGRWWRRRNKQAAAIGG